MTERLINPWDKEKIETPRPGPPQGLVTRSGVTQGGGCVSVGVQLLGWWFRFQLAITGLSAVVSLLMGDFPKLLSALLGMLIAALIIRGLDRWEGAIELKKLRADQRPVATAAGEVDRRTSGFREFWHGMPEGWRRLSVLIGWILVAGWGVWVFWQVANSDNADLVEVVSVFTIVAVVLYYGAAFLFRGMWWVIRGFEG